MRKLLLFLVLLTGTFIQLKAQEANKFRFDIRLGYATPAGGVGGFLLNLEPKWTITKGMNVGLRLGLAGYVRSLETNQNGVNNTSDGEVGASASYVGTYDYYFHNGSSSFVPFVGAGLGYYRVANIEVEDDNLDQNNQIASDGKFGGMVRAGFDWGKFRLAAEYNLVGKSDLRDVNNQVIGISKNGYVGISLGAYFGGGKWGR